MWFVGGGGGTVFFSISYMLNSPYFNVKSLFDNSRAEPPKVPLYSNSEVIAWFLQLTSAQNSIHIC